MLCRKIGPCWFAADRLAGKIAVERHRYLRATLTVSFRQNLGPAEGRFAVKHSRFNVEQIVAVLKQAEAGVCSAELIRRVGISEQTFYRWKKQYVGLEVDQVRQLKQLQEENTRLKRLVADLTLDKAMLQDVLSKKY